jgi:hypothetical protein
MNNPCWQSSASAVMSNIVAALEPTMGRVRAILEQLAKTDGS